MMNIILMLISVLILVLMIATMFILFPWKIALLFSVYPLAMSVLLISITVLVSQYAEKRIQNKANMVYNRYHRIKKNKMRK